ncbi:MAG: hypothetical protein LBN18_03750, partial [Dysgonamonadaceae bacterium]|nr:hypothetical protein [Dysgonamonadaceae bacterium]
AGIYSKTTTDDSYGLFSRSSLRNADPGGRPDNGDGIGQEGGSPVVTPAGDGLLVILLGILIYGIARYRSTLRKIIS